MTTKQRITKLEGATKRGAFVPPAKILMFYSQDGKITELDGVPVGADEASQAQAEKTIAEHPRDLRGGVSVIQIMRHERIDNDNE